MIAYLKKQGFKYTDKDDLTDKQFTLVSSNEVQDTELSSFDNIVMMETQIFNLFLNEKSYNPEALRVKLKAIIAETRTNGLLVEQISFNVEDVENGYNVTIEYIKRDL